MAEGSTTSEPNTPTITVTTSDGLAVATAGSVRLQFASGTNGATAADVSGLPITVTIPANTAHNGTITQSVTAATDTATPETGEAVNLVLGSASGVTILNPANAFTLTITDVPPQVVTVSLASASTSVAEGSSTTSPIPTITVTTSDGQPVVTTGSVQLQAAYLSGATSADFGTTFPVTISIPAATVSGATLTTAVAVAADGLSPETSEGVNLTLGSPSGVTVSGASGTFALTITDVPQVVTVSLVGATTSVAEGAQTNASITVTTSNGIPVGTTGSVQLQASYQGSATAADFVTTFPATVSIPAGTLNGNTVTSAISVASDLLTPEAGEGVNLTLGAPSGVTVSGASGILALTITDVQPNFVFLTGDNYTQDFNSLASSGSSGTLPQGWLLSEAGGNGTYAAGTGSDNAGNTYSFGAADNSDRAFGGLRSGSVVPTIGACFANQTGRSLSTMLLTYTGEHWRLGTASRRDSLKFEYKVGASSLAGSDWTRTAALDFSTPTITGTAGARDGNSADHRTRVTATIAGMSVDNGSTFCIRWIDVDASGADDGLAVDDFSLQTAYQVSTATSSNAGWRLLGPPVGLTSSRVDSVLMSRNLVQGLSDEYASATPNLFTDWDGVTLTKPTGQGAALEPGKGFLWYLFASGGPSESDPNGESLRKPLPMTFAASVPVPGAAVTATFAIRSAGDGSYMLANPYPVEFDVDAVTENNAGLLSTIYHVQDPGDQSLTAKAVSGSATSGSDLIAPWQGFFREFVSQPTDAAVTFNYGLNGARGGSSGSLFKSGSSDPISAEIALRVEGRTSAGVDVRDGGNLLVLRDDATDGWDRHDGSKFYMPSGTRVTAAFLGTHADGQPRDKSVESRAAGATATVPMTFTATSAGTYRFTWEDLGAWPSDAAPVLVDGLTGARTPMVGAGEYVFASEAEFDSRRFSVDFNGTSTDADVPSGPARLGIAAFANPLRAATHLRVEVAAPGHLSVQVVDLLGRTVATLHDGPAALGSVSLAFDPAGLPAGLYVVRAVAAGATASRTFVVAR